MKLMGIFVDGSENDRDSLRSAVMFCKAMGGRLDVFYAAQIDPVILSTDGFVMPDYHDESAAKAKAAYDDVCEGLEFVRWQEMDDMLTNVMRNRCLLYDLIILERASSERGPDVLALNVALFDTPNPVLVCPPSAPASIGKSVAVVWSPTAQAARAVHAALPILEKAERVSIITNEDDAAADPARLVDYLSLYGISPSVKTFSGGRLTARGRGRAIIDATEGLADLLVMGAYGENRLAALMGLGRATQKIVTATRVPTLIHH